MIHQDFNRAISCHSCESKNPDNCRIQTGERPGRPDQARRGKSDHAGFAGYNNERGLTLLEIIITFILAAFVGSMLVEYMGSSLTSGSEAVGMVQDGFSVNSIMEKITADYEDEYKSGNYSFETFKTNIENGNDSANSPFYGNYSVAAGYIVFVENAGSYMEAADTSGGNELLKVTIAVENQSLTTIFRK